MCGHESWRFGRILATEVRRCVLATNACKSRTSDVLSEEPILLKMRWMTLQSLKGELQRWERESNEAFFGAINFGMRHEAV